MSRKPPARDSGSTEARRVSVASPRPYLDVQAERCIWDSFGEEAREGPCQEQVRKDTEARLRAAFDRLLPRLIDRLLSQAHGSTEALSVNEPTPAVKAREDRSRVIGELFDAAR